MLTLAVRLRRVLDLTDAAVRATWGLTLDDLAADDYGGCQEVATVARTEGYEAIRYPSAARAGALAGSQEHSDEGEPGPAADNLAIFADRLHAGSELRLLRGEPLSIDSG